MQLRSAIFTDKKNSEVGRHLKEKRPKVRQELIQLANALSAHAEGRRSELCEVVA